MVRGGSGGSSVDALTEVGARKGLALALERVLKRLGGSGRRGWQGCKGACDWDAGFAGGELGMAYLRRWPWMGRRREREAGMAEMDGRGAGQK